jgi:hypothetical protein
VIEARLTTSSQSTNLVGVSDQPRLSELLRRETAAGTYSAVERSGRIEVWINGHKFGTYDDLEAAVVACQGLTCCMPDDIFTVRDEERFRAALTLDPVLDKLPSGYFNINITVNDGEWDLTVEEGFGFQETWIVSVDAGGTAEVSLIQYGPWFKQEVPEIPEMTYLWRSRHTDPHGEALAWLEICPSHQLGNLEQLNVTSEFLDPDDSDRIVGIFKHLLCSSGELTLNGATLVRAPVPAPILAEHAYGASLLGKEYGRPETVAVAAQIMAVNDEVAIAWARSSVWSLLTYDFQVTDGGRIVCSWTHADSQSVFDGLARTKPTAITRKTMRYRAPSESATPEGTCEAGRES